jgi:hypothetical protein
MMKILTKIFVLCLINFTNGHVYLRIPSTRGTGPNGDDLPLISQQGSGGYVDQYYYHGNKCLFFSQYTICPGVEENKCYL